MYPANSATGLRFDICHVACIEPPPLTDLLLERYLHWQLKHTAVATVLRPPLGAIAHESSIKLGQTLPALLTLLSSRSPCASSDGSPPPRLYARLPARPQHPISRFRPRGRRVCYATRLQPSAPNPGLPQNTTLTVPQAERAQLAQAGFAVMNRLFEPLNDQFTGGTYWSPALHPLAMLTQVQACHSTTQAGSFGRWRWRTPLGAGQITRPRFPMYC
jgi:hypothetical protein